MANQDASNPEAARVGNLRNVAQKHLLEIYDEQKREGESETRRQAELEREARRRGLARASNQTPSSDPKEKAGRMRTAEDVLNRLRWAEDVDISEYLIGYLDRFGGCLELPASRWIRDSTDEDWIPQHRIRYFKRREEIVWHRDERIDRVFGSGAAQ